MLHQGHHHWYFFFYNELNQVYFSVAIRSFALSLIGIFLPIYLYKDQAFSLQQTLGFYIFYSVVFALVTPLAAMFSARLGMKHMVLFSVPWYLAFLLCLFLLSTHKVPLYLPATFLGISIAFYWMGMHQVIYRASTRKHRGEAIGKQKALSIVGAIIGPVLGGLLISLFGFPPLFALVALLLLISAGLLFFSKENHTPYHLSFRSLFIDHRNWQNSLFFVSQGSRVIAEGVILPLFVFLILGNYLSLGILGTLLAGIGVSLLWLVGLSSDHINKRTLIRWITPLESVSWILRSLVVTFPQILAVTIFSAFTAGVREAPVGALEYDKARGNVTAYFANREIFVCLGRIFLLMLILLTNNLAGGLFFQSIANLATLLF